MAIKSRRARFDKIALVAARAMELAREIGGEYKQLDAFMDIDFADQQFPLDLDGLLQAKDSEFAHDVFGIRRHMNRQTKKLEDAFLPRYTIKS